jgi:hypothetical protein
MTEINQEVELHDDDNEVVEEAHDPKNAEAQSIASVDKAEDAGKTAPKRKGDQTKQDPMPKMPGTKAGMINAMYQSMNKMDKKSLQAMYSKSMESVAYEDGDSILENEEADFNYEADFSADLNALVNEEATLSEDFKAKAEVIFEAAIKSKLAEEIDRLEEKYNEELDAEVTATKEDLVEKVDSYLNYVVENWMEDNKLAIQTGLRTEIAEGFMNNLKDLFTESYIEVPESKVDLVDELAETVEELEEKLNSTTGNAIAMAEELESYKRDAIIAEHSKDLADTQVAKLKSLVEDVDFDDEETFAKKVATVKESYFTKESVNVETADIDTDESDDIVESSGSMAQYISALKATQS